MDLTPEQSAHWEQEGRRLAPALDAVSAVLVAGRALAPTTHLALGLAAAQSARRRVAVADLSGEAAPLRELVDDDDPHGLSDAFEFGVSLNRIARQLDDEGRLFVVPGGTEPATRAEILADERWARLVGDFRDVGALLLVVAPSDVAELDALAARLDGVVAADTDPRTQALPRLLVTAEPPAAPIAEAPAATAATAATAPAPVPAPAAPLPAEPPAAPAAPEPVGATAAPSAMPPVLAGRGAALGRRFHPALLVALGLVVIAGLVWAGRAVGRSDGPALFTTERPGEGERLAAAPTPNDAATTVAVSDSARADSLAADSAAAGTPAGAAAAPAAPVDEPLPVSNPRDLERASAFVAVLSSFTEEEAALARFRDRPRNLASVTVAYDVADSGTTYHVVTGADRGQAGARTLAEQLRTGGLARDARLPVLRLPYAVQVESGVPIAVRGQANYDSLRVALNTFLAQGFPAYALRQGGGRANIYVGAFAEPADARALIARLQAAGHPAALVVRTGRAL